MWPMLQMERQLVLVSELRHSMRGIRRCCRPSVAGEGIPLKVLLVREEHCGFWLLVAFLQLPPGRLRVERGAQTGVVLPVP